jgi:hypothetical protein
MVRTCSKHTRKPVSPKEFSINDNKERMLRGIYSDELIKFEVNEKASGY